MSSPKLVAGFESAYCHWNGHRTLESTGHDTVDSIAAHYKNAHQRGAQAVRDILLDESTTFYKPYLISQIFGDGTDSIFSLNHWNPVKDWTAHVNRSIQVGVSKNTYFIAMTEPNVGEGVSGRTPSQSVEMSIRAMFLDDYRRRWWTCDPVYGADEEEYWATDEITSRASNAVHTVGINVHGHYLRRPLREILEITQRRYPDRAIAITETSWHDGMPRNPVCAHVTNRREWLEYVMSEIRESRVNVTHLCWYPWLSMAFEPGPPWPNGYPH